ncbi:response regulator [Bacillus sp. SG-1]|uniref:response regulator n=1 Tax=Bacillus sp. SG-1 TaxID=161544 RepID=UPI0001544D0A|nr:response regulator [Bacillus sp. SG-1]EDL64105.1 YocG [Bacillus sp. SG-1]
MIRIVIAEDQEFLLGIIGSLLNLEDDMEVVGQSGKEEEVLSLVRELRPDICLMDIDMHAKAGVAQELKAFGSNLIVLTTFAKPDYFEKVKSDIKGYLPKDSSSEEFVSSIRMIMNGSHIYSPALVGDLPDDEADEEPGGTSSEEESDLKNHPDPSNKAFETVKGYFSAFKDKMKLPAG